MAHHDTWITVGPLVVVLSACVVIFVIAALLAL